MNTHKMYFDLREGVKNPSGGGGEFYAQFKDVNRIFLTNSFILITLPPSPSMQCQHFYPWAPHPHQFSKQDNHWKIDPSPPTFLM